VRIQPSLALAEICPPSPSPVLPHACVFPHALYIPAPAAHPPHTVPSRCVPLPAAPFACRRQWRYFMGLHLGV
jgi:hypothetical protein